MLSVDVGVDSDDIPWIEFASERGLFEFASESGFVCGRRVAQWPRRRQLQWRRVSVALVLIGMVAMFRMCVGGCLGAEKARPRWQLADGCRR